MHGHLCGFERFDLLVLYSSQEISFIFVVVESGLITLLAFKMRSKPEKRGLINNSLGIHFLQSDYVVGICDQDYEWTYKL